jgi:Stress responsive A/B Barrel Domain
MVRHVFLYKVASDADPNKIIETLNTLPKRVGGIRTWTLGKHQGAPGASGDLWDYALVCDFDSLAGLQKYSDDPYHMEVVEKLLPMFSARAVCDFEFDPVKGKV